MFNTKRKHHIKADIRNPLYYLLKPSSCYRKHKSPLYLLYLCDIEVRNFLDVVKKYILRIFRCFVFILKSIFKQGGKMKRKRKNAARRRRRKKIAQLTCELCILALLIAAVVLCIKYVINPTGNNPNV